MNKGKAVDAKYLSISQETDKDDYYVIVENNGIIWHSFTNAVGIRARIWEIQGCIFFLITSRFIG